MLSGLQRLLGKRSQLSSDLSAAEQRLAELETELQKHVPPGFGHAASDRSFGAEIHPLDRGSDANRERGSEALDALSPLLSEVQRLALQVDSLRTNREQLERRISAFGQDVFEEMPEPLPPTFAPILRQAMSPGTHESEVFRLLRTKIQTLNVSRRLQCFGMVSASPGEGKTTTALALALSMAGERERRVLLIEADLRKPTIECYLGLPRRVGLGDWLRGDGERLRIRRLDPPGLHLLTAGSPGGQPAELLRSARMAQLIDVVRQSFDTVIVDCPPPVPLADSVILGDLIDGFIFVVRGRHTPREEIRGALGNLRPESIRGVIFNDYSQILPRYYSRGRSRYDYYYRDPDPKR